MLFNEKQIKSSIVLDEKTGLYLLELPGIKRYFESIYYSFAGTSKSYGDLDIVFKGKNIHNKLIGITKFYDIYIICFINLENLKSEYFFVKSFDFIELKLNLKQYYVFIYNDFNNNINFYTDYNLDEFSINVLNNNISVKNNIFGTEVLSKQNILNNEIKDIKKDDLNIVDLIGLSENDFNEVEKNTIDIVDFFIYDDFFIKNNLESYNYFYDFIKNINKYFDKISIITEKYNDIFYPRIKLNLSIVDIDGSNLEIYNLRKLLLSFFTENISIFLLNNKKIENIFITYFNDFTKLKFNKLDLDFKIPDNIYVGDKNFNVFKNDLLKIRHNLFLLKETEILKIKGNNAQLQFVNNRLGVTNSNIKVTINSYEKMLIKILEFAL